MKVNKICNDHTKYLKITLGKINIITQYSINIILITRPIEIDFLSLNTHLLPISR